MSPVFFGGIMLPTDMTTSRQARLAGRFGEDGELLSRDERNRREKLCKTLDEMDRLCDSVDSLGWDSTPGRALHNLSINVLMDLLMDVALLRERVDRFIRIEGRA